MKVTPRHLVIPQLAVFTGAVLIYLGFWGGWGPVWAAGGIFFIILGLTANLLSLAWVLPGRLGNFLRHPVTNILMLALVAASLLVTVLLGVFS